MHSSVSLFSIYGKWPAWDTVDFESQSFHVGASQRERGELVVASYDRKFWAGQRAHVFLQFEKGVLRNLPVSSR